MNFKKLHQQKLFEILQALNAHGLPIDNYYTRRLAFLMNYHLTKHKITLTAYQAVNLLKIEIAEFVVKKYGRNYIHTSFPAGMN